MAIAHFFLWPTFAVGNIAGIEIAMDKGSFFMPDPVTVVAGVSALKTAFDALRSAIGLVKDAKTLLPAGDSRETAITLALESATASAKIAEAQMAKRSDTNSANANCRRRRCSPWAHEHRTDQIARKWSQCTNVLNVGAGSTGRRNTGVKSLCWRFKLQGLTWSFV
jgi:hypothetical protein